MPAPVVPLEVWLTDIEWGEADYARPTVFLGERPGDVFVVARVSTQVRYKSDDDFLIEKTNSDFKYTGLTDTSYVEAQMLEVSPAKFIKQLGTLEGGLRKDFLAWLIGSVRP